MALVANIIVGCDVLAEKEKKNPNCEAKLIGMGWSWDFWFETTQNVSGLTRT